ncbi:MAG: 2-oxo acid dehydrogenase subunit E2 [Sedimentisphaerales bacterium]|nr:2-oxo acid dehydrogenase subunit E2 [Sedimentisphaerales bacterium]
MAERLLMLALSPTMEEGMIVKWHKKEGEIITSGDVLCDVETDKAVMEYQATGEGILRKILRPEGSKAAVGDPIGILGDEAEDISSLLEEKPAAAKEPPPSKEEPAAQKEPSPSETQPPPAKAEEAASVSDAPTPAPPESHQAKPRSSPVARRLAAKHELDLSAIPGSGPKGRIVEKDVIQAIESRRQTPPSTPAAPSAAAPAAGGAVTGPAARPASGEEEIIEVSPKRALIAERLSQSKFQAPHYYLKVAVDVEGLLAGRQRHNASAPEKLSFNAYLLKFVAEALRRHPLVNATWKGDTIVKHGRIDIALAVSQPDGLITPVVRNCQHKGILQIDRELKELVEKARRGALQPEEYSDSTFTITNLGSYGIEEFTAIINPPNCAILAVGQVLKQPAVNAEGLLCVKSQMKLTLSCDHRLVDGVTGAAFLADLKRMLEFPVEMLY